MLEGFDFGVGMLVRVLGRDDVEKRVLIHTIGPVWDGNEVWLLTAGGATFAAFPGWYASLFSGFYLALFLVLVALIVRGVSFEFWGKVDSPALARDLGVDGDDRQRRRGAAVGRGLGGLRPRRADERRPQRHRHALGSAAPVRAARRPVTLTLFLAHGAMFLRCAPAASSSSARAAVARRVSPVAGALMVGFLLWTASTESSGGVKSSAQISPSRPSPCAAAGGRSRWRASATAGRSRSAPLAIALLFVSLFVELFPNALPVDHQPRIRPDARAGLLDALHARP